MQYKLFVKTEKLQLCKILKKLRLDLQKTFCFFYASPCFSMVAIDSICLTNNIYRSFILLFFSICLIFLNSINKLPHHHTYHIHQKNLRFITYLFLIKNLLIQDIFLHSLWLIFSIHYAMGNNHVDDFLSKILLVKQFSTIKIQFLL